MTREKATMGKEGSFRDKISTVDSEGKRKWIYPKKPFGTLYQWRKGVSYVLLAILFAGPFITINGHPLLMLNVFQRKFIIFGQVFWPQDFHLFLLGVLTFIIFIIFFTVIFGRVWCGWACPQTIFLEMLFRRIEYWIEGDHIKQKKLAKAPWNREKILKKGTKHALFIFFAFIIANTLLGYIIGKDKLLNVVTSPPSANVAGFTGVIVFTVLFYWIYTWFREQICTIVCPYGRLQGVLLDKDSIVVAYDYNRGEPREKFNKNRSENAGDCIDCHQCVDVCPTGIDIRNGTQMECINCTACIDACDHVMEKIGKPKGLIRYDTENNIQNKQPFRFTTRMIAYSIVLLITVGLMGFLLLNRDSTETNILKASGATYEVTENGSVRNLYNVKVINKTFDQKPIELKVLSHDQAKLNVIGEDLVAASEGMGEGTFFIELPKNAIQGKSERISVGVFSEGKKLEEVKTNFIGP